MENKNTKQGASDSGLINVHEEYEVSYWIQILGVTKDELIEAVEEVGTSSEFVRDYLGKYVV